MKNASLTKLKAPFLWTITLTTTLVVVLSIQPAFSRAQSPQSADTVLMNANVLQCNMAMDTAEAIAIRQGRIVAVGSNASMDGWISATTQVEDLQGQTVTPGLVDSHLHFVGLGQSLQMLDLKDAKSWEEIVMQVKEAAESLPKGAWIEGRGWHQSKWSTTPSNAVEGYPGHQSMSSAVPDHPVVLTHASGHACFANRAAMDVAGVNPETSDPPGGEILKDSAGQPIGVFRENAQGLIRRAQARTTARMSAEDQRAQLRERIRLAGNECLKHGITSVHDAGSSFQLASQLEELAADHQLPVRMMVMIRAGSTSLQTRLPNAKRVEVGNGFLTVRSVKVSIDGALGPHGAWLLQPYSDLPGKTGLNTVALDELERIAKLCKEHEWQLCVHAIGDRANQEVLDIYESVLGDQVNTDHRWRIEHAQHLAKEDIPRFGSLGVIPAMQANHCTSDAIFVPTRLGQRRSAEGAYVWRSLIDAGAIIPNGTDAPVERIDPRVSLFAAVTREIESGASFFPEQCMTRREMLLSYTLWPAIAAFQEENSGSIEVGKHADVVVWDTDLLRCKPREILSAGVVTTMLAGEIVYWRSN